MRRQMSNDFANVKHKGEKSSWRKDFAIDPKISFRLSRRMTTKDRELIEARVRYLCEADARLNGLKVRVRAAKHFIRMRSPQSAKIELGHLTAEADRLDLHLSAWDRYVIPTKK